MAARLRMSVREGRGRQLNFAYRFIFKKKAPFSDRDSDCLAKNSIWTAAGSPYLPYVPFIGRGSVDGGNHYVHIFEVFQAGLKKAAFPDRACFSATYMFERARTAPGWRQLFELDQTNSRKRESVRADLTNAIANGGGVTPREKEEVGEEKRKTRGRGSRFFWGGVVSLRQSQKRRKLSQAQDVRSRNILRHGIDLLCLWETRGKGPEDKFRLTPAPAAKTKTKTRTKTTLSSVFAVNEKQKGRRRRTTRKRWGIRMGRGSPDFKGVAGWGWAYFCLRLGIE
ncbi:hypothetical protein B0H19DRAFT_1235019 [Mycena capillaripes]|nr:hypothetical protein B0H19DRAFT_1235019 [Mycena capillaripes]